MKCIQVGLQSDEINSQAGSSLWEDAWKRLQKNKLAWISGLFLVLLGIGCLFWPSILAGRLGLR